MTRKVVSVGRNIYKPLKEVYALKSQNKDNSLMRIIITVIVWEFDSRFVYIGRFFRLGPANHYPRTILV